MTTSQSLSRPHIFALMGIGVFIFIARNLLTISKQFTDKVAIQGKEPTLQLEKTTSPFPCGEWTPNGNLGNPNFDPRTVAPVLEGWESCRTGGSQVQVGMDYRPDKHHGSSTQLFCNPDLKEGGRENSILVLDVQFRSGRNNSTGNLLNVVGQLQPEYSLVIPSHCAASTMEKTIPSICNYTAGLWEVIFILDSSWDESLQVLRNILLSPVCQINKGLLRARILMQPTSIYETSADNLGFSLGNPSHFFVEVQSDMYLSEYGWNRDLARPFFEYDDIFSISGRCGHPVNCGGNSVGRCGADVGELNEVLKNQTRDSIIITQTSNRGPVVWRADALRSLNFLDEVNFYLGDDDHDLNRRAMHRGWYTAYKYAAMYAPLNLSPGRNAALKARIPEEIKAKEATYREIRAGLSNHACDPSIPFGQFSPVCPSESRVLSSILPNFDWDSPLPGLPRLQNF